MAKTAYSPMELWRGRVGSEVYAVQNGKQVIRNYSPTKGNPQALADWRKRNLLAFVNVDNKPITLSIWKNSDGAPTLRLQYSKNGIQWHEWGLTSTTPLTVQIQTGSRIYMRGIGNTSTGAYHEGDAQDNLTATNCNQINADGLFACEGELFRILDYKNNENTPLKPYAFACLFRQSNIVLPPNLSSIYLNNDCYNELFRQATNLTTQPILPAKTVPIYAYTRMFQNCTSLTETNKILAEEMKAAAAYDMFYSSKIKEISFDNLKKAADDSLSSVFMYCDELTKVNLNNLTQVGYRTLNNCFRFCKALKQTPTLNIPILQTASLSDAFSGCTNLEEVTIYATNAATANATNNWLLGVPSTGKFRTPANADWGDERSPSLIPEGWDRIDI